MSEKLKKTTEDNVTKDTTKKSEETGSVSLQIKIPNGAQVKKHQSASEWITDFTVIGPKRSMDVTCSLLDKLKEDGVSDLFKVQGDSTVFTYNTELGLLAIVFGTSMGYELVKDSSITAPMEMGGSQLAWQQNTAFGKIKAGIQAGTDIEIVKDSSITNVVVMVEFLDEELVKDSSITKDEPAGMVSIECISDYTVYDHEWTV